MQQRWEKGSRERGENAIQAAPITVNRTGGEVFLCPARAGGYEEEAVNIWVRLRPKQGRRRVREEVTVGELLNEREVAEVPMARCR